MDGQAQGWTLQGLWRVGSACVSGTHLGYHDGACEWPTGLSAGDATFTVDLTGVVGVPELHMRQRIVHPLAWPYEDGASLAVAVAWGGGAWTTPPLTLTDTAACNAAPDREWVDCVYDLSAARGAAAVAVRITGQTYRQQSGVHGLFVDDVRLLDAIRPPTARAGPDGAHTDHDGDGSILVHLDGSASTPYGSPIASYTWSLGGTTVASTATASLAMAPGVHTFTLLVVAEDGQSATDTVVHTVATNAPPIARAGADITAFDGDASGSEMVRLDGSASTDTGGIVAYAWSVGGSPLGETPNVTWDAPLGEHLVTLTVRDAANATSTDEVLVSVVSNRPPLARVHPPTRFHADGNGTALVWIDGRESRDPDGPLASTVWTSDADGSVVATTPLHQFRLAVGVHGFTLNVTDASGASATASTSVEVYPDAIPEPRIGCCCLDTVCRFDATASTDTDGPIVALEWDFGDGTTATGWHATRTYAQTGTYPVTLRARDDVGGEGVLVQPFTITRSAHAPPAAPPAQVVVSDTSGDTVASAVYDVQRAWFEVNDTHLWVGLKVGDVPPPTTRASVQWSVLFYPDHDHDRSWGGRIPANVNRLLRVAATRDVVDTTYQLQLLTSAPNAALTASTVVAPLVGSADPATDIVWWTVPRTLLQSPPPGTTLRDVRIASTWHGGDRLSPRLVIGDESPQSGQWTFPCAPPAVPVQRTPIVNPAIPPPPSGPPVLLADYRMDEAASTILDASGNGHHGSRIRGIATTGKYGGGYYFPRDSEYITIPSQPTSGLLRGTVALWVKMDGTGADGKLVERITRSNVVELSLSVDPTTLKVWAGTGPGNSVLSDKALQAGVWHHVAFTWSEHGKHLYIDGALTAQSTNSVGVGTAAESVCVGVYCINRSGRLGGRVDELVFYNEALSAGDIIVLRDGGRP